MLMPDLTMQVARRIRETRSRVPTLTAKMAADFLQISLREWDQLEAGDIRPTPEQIILLADLMNVEPSWFFEGFSDEE